MQVCQMTAPVGLLIARLFRSRNPWPALSRRSGSPWGRPVVGLVLMSKTLLQTSSRDGSAAWPGRAPAPELLSTAFLARSQHWPPHARFAAARDHGYQDRRANADDQVVTARPRQLLGASRVAATGSSDSQCQRLPPAGNAVGYRSTTPGHRLLHGFHSSASG